MSYESKILYNLSRRLNCKLTVVQVAAFRWLPYSGLRKTQIEADEYWIWKGFEKFAPNESNVVIIDPFILLGSKNKKPIEKKVGFIAQPSRVIASDDYSLDDLMLQISDIAEVVFPHPQEDFHKHFQLFSSRKNFQLENSIPQTLITICSTAVLELPEKKFTLLLLRFKGMDKSIEAVQDALVTIRPDIKVKKLG